MSEWSVLNDSISEFIAAANKNRLLSTSFLYHEIISVLFQLNQANSEEALYQLACIHRQWDSPLINRIFFSGLNQFRDKFGDFYIDMLISEFCPSAYIPQRDHQYKEADYARLVKQGAPDIFPKFAAFQREAVFEGFRTDLLAKKAVSGRHVLFELKSGTEDPTPQLMRYSKHFKDPILIGITGKALPPHKRREGVYYLTYDMLNQMAAANICRKFSGRNALFSPLPSEFDFN